MMASSGWTPPNTNEWAVTAHTCSTSWPGERPQAAHWDHRWDGLLISGLRTLSNITRKNIIQKKYAHWPFALEISCGKSGGRQVQNKTKYCESLNFLLYFEKTCHFFFFFFNSSGLVKLSSIHFIYLVWSIISSWLFISVVELFKMEPLFKDKSLGLCN